MPNLRSKIFWNFSFTKRSGLNFSERGLGQFFLVMLNLRSKLFQNFFNLHSILNSEFLGGRGSGHQSFFGHAKFEVKIFLEFFSFTKHSGLNFSEGVWENFFGLSQIWDQTNFWNFFVYWVLWTPNFLQGESGHQLFLVTLNLRANIFQNFFFYRAFWTLNLSGEGTNFFSSC